MKKRSWLWLPSGRSQSSARNLRAYYSGQPNWIVSGKQAGDLSGQPRVHLSPLFIRPNRLCVHAFPVYGCLLRQDTGMM